MRNNFAYIFVWCVQRLGIVIESKINYFLNALVNLSVLSALVVFFKNENTTKTRSSHRDTRKKFYAIQNTVVIVLVILTYSSVIPQSMAKLETDFSKLITQYENQFNKLDSLNAIYQKKIDQIEREKGKDSRDESKIEKLMASSVTLSKEIDGVQKNVDRLKSSIESKKKQLYNLYTHTIDSLGNVSSKSSAKVQDEIMKLKEKRLLVSPRLLPLSYNPEKIISLDLNSTQSVEEANLMREYIKNAKAEVNQVYEKITATINEISQIVKLEKKTKKFIEETGFDNGIKQSSISQRTVAMAEDGSFNGLDPGSADKEISMQYNSYNFILNQLRSIDNPGFNSTDFTNVVMNTSGVSYRQYLKVLEEVKEGLEDYRLILNKKSGNR
ncbi:MAG: hypothetical protein V1720_14920 [bacterium]